MRLHRRAEIHLWSLPRPEEIHMAKARRKVTSMSGVIKAYGGRDAFARSFPVTVMIISYRQ